MLRTPPNLHPQPLTHEELQQFGPPLFRCRAPEPLWPGPVADVHHLELDHEALEALDLHFLELGTPRVVKITRPIDRPTYTDALYEAELLRCLNGLGVPRVPRYIAHGVHRAGTATRVLLAMDDLGGETALNQAAELGQDPLAFAVHSLETLVALEAVGVSHGDLKLENMLVLSDGQIALVDFAQATLHSDARVRRRLTPQYAAPDDPGTPANPASDLHAWGVSVLGVLAARAGVEDIGYFLRREDRIALVQEYYADQPLEWLAALAIRCMAPGPQDRGTASEHLATLRTRAVLDGSGRLPTQPMDRSKPKPAAAHGPVDDASTVPSPAALAPSPQAATAPAKPPVAWLAALALVAAGAWWLGRVGAGPAAPVETVTHEAPTPSTPATAPAPVHKVTVEPTPAPPRPTPAPAPHPARIVMPVEVITVARPTPQPVQPVELIMAADVAPPAKRQPAPVRLPPPVRRRSQSRRPPRRPTTLQRTAHPPRRATRPVERTPPPTPRVDPPQLLDDPANDNHAAIIAKERKVWRDWKSLQDDVIRASHSLSPTQTNVLFAQGLIPVLNGCDASRGICQGARFHPMRKAAFGATHPIPGHDELRRELRQATRRAFPEHGVYLRGGRPD